MFNYYIKNLKSLIITEQIFINESQSYCRFSLSQRAKEEEWGEKKVQKLTLFD